MHAIANVFQASRMVRALLSEESELEQIAQAIEEIKAVEEQFDGSGFVKEKIGVAAVCEPCAYLATGKKGHKIAGKEKSNGITLSIWEEK